VVPRSARGLRDRVPTRTGRGAMRARIGFVVAALLAVITAGSLSATAASGSKFSATLTGYQETPTLSVAGLGTFSAEIAKDGQSISYSLSYSGLSGDALFAHIHLGEPAIAGGVVAFLCGGGSKLSCPTGTSATVTGTIVPADVIGPSGQGIDAGEFEELVAAMRFGATYANVHTTLFPAGEIRGQIS
jgi:hypothetical protein